MCGGGTGRASYDTCAPSSRSKFILFLFLSFPPSLSSSLLGNRRRGGGFELQPSSTLKATRKGNSSVERKEDVRDSRGPRSLTPIRFYTVVFVFVTTGEKILTRTVSRTPVTMEANSDKTAINPAIIFFFFSVGTPVTQSTRFAQRAGHYTVE